MARAIYVGITIRSDLESLWHRTQEPALHERWDLRFSRIEYIPKSSDDQPQRFRYSTRLGLGVCVSGWGESVASRIGDETGTSTLRFGSNSPLSLIREGSGYWKYTATGGGVDFETGYDYGTRWGWVGRAIDGVVFRPLIGWATAWSFDRLRLWIEEGVDPALSLTRWLTNAAARIGLAGVFAFHGLVPKVLTRHPEDLELIARTGMGEGAASGAAMAVGVLEVCYAAALLVLWRARWVYALTAVLLVTLAATGSAAAGPGVAPLQPGEPDHCGGDVVRRWMGVLQGPPLGAAVPAETGSGREGRARMTSIYQRALGARFEELHPQIQRRFSLSSGAGECCVGTGVMHRVWHGAPFTLPFLWVGAWRHIMFPESGRDVPFRIHNYAYLDGFGRETVTWVREFDGRRHRRFDATMIYSEQRGRIVDYLGSHQHRAVDIDLGIAENGGLRLRSGDQRFYEGVLGFRFPMLFSGIADVCEWFDDASQRFCIDVFVHNPVWGPLFGYTGTFACEWKPCGAEQVPTSIKPVREERRE